MAFVCGPFEETPEDVASFPRLESEADSVVAGLKVLKRFPNVRLGFLMFPQSRMIMHVESSSAAPDAKSMCVFYPFAQDRRLAGRRRRARRESLLPLAMFVPRIVSIYLYTFVT